MVCNKKSDRFIGSVFCFYLVTFWLCQYISLVPPIGSLCWLIVSLVRSVWCSARRIRLNLIITRRIRLNLIINVESVVRFVRNFQFGPFGRLILWSTAILLCFGPLGHNSLFSFVLATAKTFCVIMYRCSRRRRRRVDVICKWENIFVRPSDHSFRVFCWALFVFAAYFCPPLSVVFLFCVPVVFLLPPSFSSLSLFAVVVLCYVCALC
jgi:hypothetical protein